MHSRQALIQINAVELRQEYQKRLRVREGGSPAFQRSDLYMTDHSNKIKPIGNRARTRHDELMVFVVIVALIWPVGTIGLVGGYGFAVWMYQLVAGPPGPPRR
jgi:periplasmic nitrate reductase NapE